MERSRHRWLAIALPWWPSDLARRQRRREAAATRGAVASTDAPAPTNHARAAESPRDAPLLIHREHRKAKEVVAVCPHAHTAGARPGMPLAQAKALCGLDVIEVEWTPDADRRALRKLARWSTRYGPLVMPIGEAHHGDDAARVAEELPSTRGAMASAAVIVDITGCDAVHGGESALVTRVLRDLHKRALHGQVAIASTQTAALAASAVWPCRVLDPDPRAAATALAELPLWTLRLPIETLEALREVNVRRIGEALALPRDGSADRFGERLFAVLDALRGEREEPFTPLPHAAPVDSELLFEGPTTRLEAVELAVQKVLDRFVARLARRQRGVRVLELSLLRVDALPIVETLPLGRPSRNAKHLWTLLRPRVERANMGFGIEGVTVRALVDAPLSNSQRRWSMMGTVGLVGMVGRDPGHTRGAAHGGASAPHGIPGAAGVTEFDESPDGAGEDARCVGEMIDQMSARLGADAVRIPARELGSGLRGERGRGDRADAGSAFSSALRPTVVFPRALSAEVIAEEMDALAAPAARRPTEVRWAGGGGRVIECDGPERHSPRWWSDRHRSAPVPQAATHAVAPAHAAAPEHDLDCWRVRTADGRWLWLLHRRPDHWTVIGAWA